MRAFEANATCLLVVPRTPKVFPGHDGSSSGRANVRRGFTLIELLTVIAILAILVSMLLPSLRQAQELAYKVRCLMHLGLLMTAHVSYATDNQQLLPGPDAAVDWSNSGANDPWGISACLPIQGGALYKAGYLRDPKIWLCPAVTLRSPGEYYYQYPERSFGGGLPWTAAEVQANPYTYHYSYNMRVFFDRACDGLDWNKCVTPDQQRTTWYAGYSVDTQTFDQAKYMRRRVDSFADTSRVIMLAEENTGKVPWDNTPGWGAGWGGINDPFFCTPDTTENRHLNVSGVGYLDGHSGEITPSINLSTDARYYCAPQ